MPAAADDLENGHKTSDPATVADTAVETTGFFTIPAEVRIKIYELVCYHENGGLIAPLPMSRSRHGKADHYCTLSCLLQPAITKVNRRIRAESLPVFYDVNQFFVRPDDFPFTWIDGEQWWGQHGLVEWWRAIGDENLQTIRSFQVACSPSIDNGQLARIKFDFGQSSSANTASVTCTSVLEYPSLFGWPDRLAHPARNESEQRFVEYRKYKKTRFTRIRAKDLGIVTQSGTKANWVGEALLEAEELLKPLRMEGLHVRGLEALLIAMEPHDKEYIPDHSALGDDIKIGFAM